MKRKAILKTSIKNIKFSFLIFFILTIPKVILTQKIIAIHFYEMLDINLGDNEIKNCISSDKSLEFVNKNPIQFSFDPNTRVSQVFFIDLDIFYLDFSREEEVQESQHHNIYINSNIVNYDEIVYFYNIVMNFPNIIDNINEYKYRLTLYILDILKIKTNKKFEDFIRLMLASFVFNTIETKEWKVVVPKTKEPSFSSFISKKVIMELLNLYFISEKTLEKIKDISYAVKCTEYFSFDFINLNEDYFYLDNDIIQEILKIHKRSMNFLKILDFLLSIHSFNGIFLSNIFYTENFNLFFEISIFKSLEQIFIYQCSNADVLIQKIINVSSSRCIQTLNIIRSEFTIEDEILWLIMLDLKAINYIVGNTCTFKCFVNSDLDSLFPNIFSRLIDEIYNYNKSNFFVQTGEVSCYDKEKTIIFQFYQEKNNLENLTIIESPLQKFFGTGLFNPFLSLDFYTINFKEFRNIQLYFKNIWIKDFELPKSGIVNNISRIGVYESTFNAVFLSKILILSGLKEVSFRNCTIALLKHEIDFEENLNIERFYFGTSIIDDQYHFVKFLNHMIGLKLLDIFILINSEVSNIYTFQTDDIFANHANLKFLSYVFHFSKNMVPVFPMFPRLLEFHFGSNYSKGTLHKIFYNNNFSGLKKLNIDSIDIGKEDEFTFETYTGLLSLSFSECFACSDIKFFQLFDLSKVYSLVELKLPDIEITSLDLHFFSKLKSLKRIYIYRLSVQPTIIYFFKSLSSLQQIKIEKLSVYKNEIYEEFGEKIQRLFSLTYSVNLDI